MTFFEEHLKNADSTPSPNGKIQVRSIYSLDEEAQKHSLQLVQSQFPLFLSRLQNSSNIEHKTCSLLIAQSYWLNDTMIGVAFVTADHDTLGTLHSAVALTDWNYYRTIESALANALHKHYHCIFLTTSPSKKQFSQQIFLVQAGYRPLVEQKDLSSTSYIRRIGRVPRSPIKTISLREICNHSECFARILLHECYRLYEESFPDPDEQESEGHLWRSLTRSLPHWDILAVYRNGKLIGARHLSLFNTDHEEVSSFAVGEYLYVDRSVRRQGYGRTLIEETEKFIGAWNIRVILSEQKDPYVMNRDQLASDEASGISTLGRLTFWHSMGYECCDELYFSPPVEQGKKPSLYYRLAIKRLDTSFPNSLSQSAYLAMIKAYHESWVTAWEQEPLTKHFMNILAQRDSNRVSLIELLKERSCKEETLQLGTLPH